MKYLWQQIYLYIHSSHKILSIRHCTNIPIYKYIQTFIDEYTHLPKYLNILINTTITICLPTNIFVYSFVIENNIHYTMHCKKNVVNWMLEISLKFLFLEKYIPLPKYLLNFFSVNIFWYTVMRNLHKWIYSNINFWVYMQTIIYYNIQLLKTNYVC